MGSDSAERTESSERFELAFHGMAVADVVAALATDAHRGLGEDEARRRLETHGRNQLEAAKPVPGWRRLLAQLKDVLVVLLLVAAAISAGLWLIERNTAVPYEALAILAVVVLNAVMGWLQQARAERAVAALRDMSAARATVVRGGARHSVPAAELVPGDVILVEAGDTIPADARLLHAVALQTAEAALTGESLPVAKEIAAVAADAALGDRSDMIWSGTAATSGRGRAVVTATGMQTQMGRIATLLEEVPDEGTPLQRELDRVGRLLGIVVVVIAFAMIATLLTVHEIRGLHALFEVLIFGVALAVAAVPEGLPAVVTVVLSIGVQRMAKRNAIVRNLAAVETLGSANVIASDKTGTLTRNEMTVRRVVTASGSARFEGTGYEPEGEVRADAGGPLRGALRLEIAFALGAADRATNAVLQEQGGRWTVQGDPTEGALIVAARKTGLADGALDARLERIGEVPFSSERKLMSTIYGDAKRDQRLLAFTKGAPDVLLARCTSEQVGRHTRALKPERRAEIAARNEELAGDALRTIGVAYRLLRKDAFLTEDFDERLEEDLVFLGLIGMLDPPREEASASVARARGAGIRPLMITGDHPKTAAVIAAELGIDDDGGRVVTGPELASMPPDELEQTVREVSVYARVNPEHKLDIVSALQAGGAIVAMTGDGVNDAPALRAADIGVAMGRTGTDVSREAADMVLADDNFATIVAAVEEGRAIFANIRKFLRYLLATNIGEVLTMFFGVLLAHYIGLADQDDVLALPLLATQLLWINMLTDGAPALALGVEGADPDVMQTPPRPRGERVVNREMWRGILLVGAVMAAGTLYVLDASLPGGLVEGGGTLRYAQTMSFTTLVFFQLFSVWNARSDRRSAFSGLFSNRWLWGAVGLAAALQAAVVYVPVLQMGFGTVNLRAEDWLFCVAVASSVLWLRELSKGLAWAARRLRTRDLQGGDAR